MTSVTLDEEQFDVASKQHVLVLEAGRGERHYWRDIWAYRELFAILAWRDVAVRYKQTVIGVAWAIVRPIITMVISLSCSAVLPAFRARAVRLTR